MPRSLLEFERAMPVTRIVPYPVFPERVPEQGWSAWRGTASLLIGKYGKYLAALFRLLFCRDPVAHPAPPATEVRR
jgi:uncharacterized SAM-binding protein YcdF (DUF218 family)